VARFLVALICLATLPGVLAGQADTAQADRSKLGVRPTFAFPPLTLAEPELLRAPWLKAHRVPPALRALAWDSTVATVLDSVRSERVAALRYLRLYGTPLPGELPATPGPPETGKGVFGLSQKYANLAIDGQARLEIRTDRVREERCSPALALDPNSGCRGNFKAPGIDNQVNIRSTGVLGRRVHLNVDFDTERDYSSNNNIQVYYEGLSDEIIRRIDVGTVAFQPPPSRFITAGVPANNFGINASFEVGPMQFQTLAATQKGSVVGERTYSIGQTTSQAQDRQARDLDFESGRFFWVVDPDSLPGFPALDILALNPDALSPGYRPSRVHVYRYRAVNSKSGLNPNLGGITALARRSDSPQQFGPVQWELLIQGTDYYLDPSGLWLVLASKLDQNDYLAVSYQTLAETQIGTFPVKDQGSNGVVKDTLELIVQPQQGPDLPTFRYEMRQVYRVAGADLELNSLAVAVTLNRSERPLTGSTGTYLQLLGLATPSDPTLFDRDNRLFPRTRDPSAAQVIRDYYVVFPTLQPFADKTRLSAEEISDSLYSTPLFLLLSQGPPAKFALSLHYDATGGGDRSTLNLNALQLREGSEQLSVGGRRLVRGVDYSISYDLGQVTFLNPDALFGQGSTQVTARFEEQGLFAVAPTTILGLSTRYSLGDLGAVNLIGLYQWEQSAFNRPPLGFEASANLIGGANTELHFKPTGISRFLSHLTSRRAVAPSLLDVNAEFALTKPDPNRSGQAYLEEFESDGGVAVSLQESAWEFGSRPQQSAGVEDIGFAAGFDPDDAVALTWQNLIPGPSGGALELHPQDIDTLILIAGRGEAPETIMYLTMHADTAGGIVQQNNSSRWSLPPRDLKPRWRSMVTSLNATGLDLTRDEFLEFWIFQPAGQPADSAGLRLVVDLGTVSEDAVAIAPDTLVVSGADTTYTGRQYVGQGRLDTERTDIGIFNAQTDDIGILGDRPDQIMQAGLGPVTDLSLCNQVLSNTVPVFPWGDLSSRCTRGNGTLDTEDLNGDAVLDASGPNENVFRYIVDLAADSFFVRNGVTTTDPQGRVTQWKLYRIPIRKPNYTLNTPTLRLVQQLRMTLVTPPDNGQPDIVSRLAIARLRFVGSTWVRRAETPISGLTGSLGLPHGEVSVSVVSTENRTDLGYESPPGIIDNVSRRAGDRAAQGTQINEKSLRIVGRAMGLNERAEAYLRFPSGPQNLLTYRNLRIWFRGRGAGWDEGDLQAFVKLGSDNDNFYLYRSSAKSGTWEPEAVIDLETWRRLRALVENRWLGGEPPSGASECGTDQSDAYVACEGPYLVHVKDPGVSPPNLAAVQEISTGIYRVSETVSPGESELWIDDIRLGEPVSQTGMATSVDARLTASDVGALSLSYVRQNGQFRQINESPSYRASDVLQIAGNLQLDRFLPTSLGLAVPLTVSYAHTSVNPDLLTGTDLRGAALAGLRRPLGWSSTYLLSVRRNTPGRNWITRGLADPLSVTVNLTQGRNRTELSEAQAQTFILNLNYALQLRRRGFRLPLTGLIKGLPRWLRESEAGKSLTKADISLVPSRIRLSSGINRDESNSTAFRVPVVRADDDLLQPTIDLTHLWRNSAGLNWQPLGMLNLDGDLTSTRDLRVYSDSTSIGRLAYANRKFLLGVPVGVERDRTVRTVLSLTPVVTSWLRPRFLTSSAFRLSRNLTSREPVRENGDSGGFILPQTLNNSRSNEIGVSLDFALGLRRLLGDSSFVGKAIARVRPLDLSTRLVRTSTFDLTAFDPDLNYQLALGGLQDFLVQNGVIALGASEGRVATVTGGADLPYGFSLSLSHALSRTTRFNRVNDSFIETETKQQEWPAGTLRWSRTFNSGALALVALGTSFRHRDGSSRQPNQSGAAAETATSSSSINPDVQLALRNGMSVSLGLNDLNQRNAFNGNETDLEQQDLTGSFNYGFRLPRLLSHLRKQARTSVTLLSTKTKSCLQQSNQAECIPVSDVSRREIRGGIDADFLQTLSGGLQINYSINDAKHLNRRTSQISIIASFQLSLFAGDYR
jgi:motility/secretion related protein SprA